MKDSSLKNLGPSPQPGLVVTVTVAGVSNASYWEGTEPFLIGHPARWSLERPAEGVVRITNLQFPGLERDVAAKELKRELGLELPEPRGVRSLFKLELRPIDALPPAFETHEGQTGELRIYNCRGAWTRESASLDKPYAAYVGDLHVFTVRNQGPGQYAIKATTDDLISEQVSFERGQELTFSEDELVGMILSVGEFQWRFDTLKRTTLPPLLGSLPEEALTDAAEFRKALKASFASVAAVLFIAFFWPRPQTDLVPPPQETKLVFKPPFHPKVTSAPSGHFAGIDKPMGEHRQAKPPRHVGVQKLAKSTANKGPHKPTHRIAEQKVRTHAKAKPTLTASESKSRKAPGPLSKKPALAHVEAPKSKKIARSAAPPKTQQAKAKPTTHDRDSEMAKVFHGSGFRQASQGLVNGGMTELLHSSHFGRGSDAHSEAKGLLGGKSALSAAGGVPGGGGGGGGGGGLGTRAVNVASLGGGEGLFGEKGVGYGRGSHARINGQGRSFISLDSGESDVDEGLTKEQVGRVIHSHMSEIRYCYDAAKLRSPEVEGKLAVRFTVAGSGAVASSGVNQSTLGDSAFDSCVIRRLASWQFPHPKGGVNVAVTYPFIFKTLGR